MNFRNLIALAVLVAAMALAYIYGGYATLHPVIFLAGLCGAVLIGSYTAITTETRALVVFLVSSTVLAAVDEYAHTSAGTLMYFDGGIPSLLTVFGWGIFLLVMLCVARLLMRIPAFSAGEEPAGGQRLFRIIPVLIPCALIVLSVPLLGYGPVVTPLLAGVYLLLAALSLYYATRLTITRSLAILIAALLTGALMEYLGALEGFWSFHYGEPVSLFILFSWPIRFFAVLCICHLAGYDVCMKAQAG